MPSLVRKLAARGSRGAIQLLALVAVATSVGVSIWAGSRTAIVLAALSLGFVTLGATKLALISLVSSNRLAIRTEASVSALENAVGLALARIEAVDELPSELARVEQRIADLRQRVESIAEETQTLSRLIEPTATLVELKEQELMALREQLRRE